MNLSTLIREAKEGSTAAQKCLFDQLSGKMELLCRRYVKNKEDAEEIMLDGFYKFFKNLPAFTYQGDASLLAWIKRIMVNECLMFLRKKNVFVLVSEKETAAIVLQEDVLDNLSAAEIFNLIIQLPVGYRTVFNLYEIEGMDHKEVAALMAISEGTSKSQLSKAKSLLQKMILQNGMEYVKRKAK